MNAVLADVLLQSAGELLPSGVVNGSGLVVTLAGLAIVVAWVAYLFR